MQLAVLILALVIETSVYSAVMCALRERKPEKTAGYETWKSGNNS